MENAKIYIRLIRSKGITAYLIRLGMWLYAILRFKKPTKTYNHVEVGYGVDGALSSGAIAKGIRIRPWNLVLKHYKGKVEVKSYIIPVTDVEYSKFLDYMLKVNYNKYEFGNFFLHLLKIIFGVWVGKRSTKKLYCYEHGIYALNATGKYNLDPYLNPYEFQKWADKNIKDIQIQKYML